MSRNLWSRHAPTFDNAPDEPYLGRRPSDEMVRTATRRYIVADFVKNGKNYAPNDYDRVYRYITETSPLNSKAQ